MDSNAKIAYVGKHGAWYYNLWRDAEHPRGLWRRTKTLDEYRSPAPRWETVLDVDALGKAEKESWVFQGARVPQARAAALPRHALSGRRRTPRSSASSTSSRKSS